ncbi:rCG52738 [Rattus norvegicus]|uniref:RCG52738 n=1 Tax=Rattus norvegicus TaxID=10116 RepID=A6IQM6_RAT|nr:rCG52738 [Rattus norvegicus]
MVYLLPQRSHPLPSCTGPRRLLCHLELHTHPYYCYWHLHNSTEHWVPWEETLPMTAVFIYIIMRLLRSIKVSICVLGIIAKASVSQVLLSLPICISDLQFIHLKRKGD